MKYKQIEKTEGDLFYWKQHTNASLDKKKEKTALNLGFQKKF